MDFRQLGRYVGLMKLAAGMMIPRGARVLPANFNIRNWKALKSVPPMAAKPSVPPKAAPIKRAPVHSMTETVLAGYRTMPRAASAVAANPAASPFKLPPKFGHPAQQAASETAMAAAPSARRESPVFPLPQRRMW